MCGWKRDWTSIYEGVLKICVRYLVYWAYFKMLYILLLCGTYTHTFSFIFFGNHIGCRIINKFNLTYTTKTCQNMLVSSCFLFFFRILFSVGCCCCYCFRRCWAVVHSSFLLPFLFVFFILCNIMCCYVRLVTGRLVCWCSQLSVAFVCISVNLVVNALWEIFVVIYINYIFM